MTRQSNLWFVLCCSFFSFKNRAAFFRWRELGAYLVLDFICRMPERPFQCVIRNLLPAVLTQRVMRAFWKFFVFGHSFCLPVQLEVCFNDRGWRNMVLTARNEQQWSAIIVLKVNRSRRMRIEIGESGLEQHVIRSRHCVSVVHSQRLFQAQVVREGIVKLFRTER